MAWGEKYFEDKARTIKGRLLYIDIDNTLVISDKKDEFGELDYTKSVPIKTMIDCVNALYENNTIVLYTARGARTGKIDWHDFTKKQMEQFGIKYHRLRMDKPHFDLLIDDKAVTNMTQLIAGTRYINDHIEDCMTINLVREGVVPFAWNVTEFEYKDCDLDGIDVIKDINITVSYLWLEFKCADKKCSARKRIAAMNLGFL